MKISYNEQIPPSSYGKKRIGENQRLINKFLKSDNDNMCLSFRCNKDATSKAAALRTIKKQNGDTSYNIIVRREKVFLVRLP